jgi:hypothetical protein
VDAFEESVNVLRVEALVDSLLVRGVVLDETQSRHKYAVRLRMRPMNLPTPLSCIIIISERPISQYNTQTAMLLLMPKPKIGMFVLNCWDIQE